MTVPAPPDLNSEGYVGHFITWKRDSMQRYVDFDFSGVSLGIGVAAIELSFLNSPANRISLPDLQLFRVNSYGATFAADSVSWLPSIMLDNEDLTQTDNQIRTVTIQPIIAQSGPRFRIHFSI